MKPKNMKILSFGMHFKLAKQMGRVQLTMGRKFHLLLKISQILSFSEGNIHRSVIFGVLGSRKKTKIGRLTYNGGGN